MGTCSQSQTTLQERRLFLERVPQDDLSLFERCNLFRPSCHAIFVGRIAIDTSMLKIFQVLFSSFFFIRSMLALTLQRLLLSSEAFLLLSLHLSLLHVTCFFDFAVFHVFFKILLIT